MIRRIITYLLSSGITVLVDFAVFSGANALGAGIALSTALGRAVAAVVNFTINRNAVFQAEGNALVQFLKYILLVIISGSISAFAISQLQKVLPLNPTLIKVPVEAVLFFVNYAVQRLLIFKPTDPEPEKREEQYESN